MGEVAKSSKLMSAGIEAYDCWYYEKREKTSTSYKAGAAEDLILHVEGRLLKRKFRSLSQIPGFEHIKESLEEEYHVKEGNTLQLAAAPQILGGRNCFIVGTSKSKAGKTLAYLMSIVAPLINETVVHNARVERKMGPRVLILCASYTTGTAIEEMLHHMCDGTLVQAKFLHEHSKFARKTKGSSKLVSEMDIVVSTIEYAIEVIRDPRSGFSFDSLTHLVLDEAHVLLKCHQKEVELVFSEIKDYAQQVSGRPCLLQTIFCSGEWNDSFEPWFRQVTAEPILLISSAVQMMNYCKFNIQVVGTKTGCRGQSFTALLDKHESAMRILVAVSDLEVMAEVKQVCFKHGVNAYFLEGEGLVGARIDYAKKQWYSTDQRKIIIVTTDLNLRELNVSKPDVLIHYDIPTYELRTFAIRYSPMWTHGIVEKTKDFVSYVLIPIDNRDLHVVVWKLKKLGAIVTEDLSQIAAEYQKRRMDQSELCMGFKCFGNCKQIETVGCNRRHYFLQSDFIQDTNVPPTGQVEIYITQVISPNVFIAKLLRYWRKDPVTNEVLDVVDCVELNLERHQKMKDIVTNPHYKNEITTFAPGTKVVLAWREKYQNRHVYTRGEIIKVATRSYLGSPLVVIVKCIDIGIVVKINAKELYAMPEEFVALPPLSVEIILGTLLPPFGEKSFRSHHTQEARDLLTANPNLHADIALTIRSSVWVRRLVKVKKVNKKFIEVWDAGKAFVDRGIGIKSPSNLECLYEACEQQGYSCEIYRQCNHLHWSKDPKFQREYFQASETFSWAHLHVAHSETPIYEEMTVCHRCVDTGSVFGRLKKFSGLLHNLEDELTQSVLDDMAKKSWNEVDGFETYYKKGMIVAAFYDGGFRRALIQQCHPVMPGSFKPTFTVFLVDLGKMEELPMGSLFPIKKSFVSRMNFQVIQLQFDYSRGKESPSEEMLSGKKNLEIMAHKQLRCEVTRPAKYLVKCRFATGDKEESLEAQNYGHVFSVEGAIIENDYAHTNHTQKSAEEETAVVEKAIDEAASDEDGPDYSLSDELLETCLVQWYGEKFAEEVMRKKCNVDKSRIPSDSDQLHPKSSKAEAVRTENAIETRDEFANSTELANAEEHCSRIALIEDLGPCPEGRVVEQTSSHSKKVYIDWFQTEEHIILRIQLHDVLEHDVLVKDDRLTLDWKSIQPPGYGFSLVLFKKVESNLIEKLLGQYVELKLTKRLKGLKWRKLARDCGNSWIKPEMIKDDDLSDFEESSFGGSTQADMYDQIDSDDDWRATADMPDDMIG